MPLSHGSVDNEVRCYEKKTNRAALKEDPEHSNNYHMKMSIIIS